MTAFEKRYSFDEFEEFGEVEDEQLFSSEIGTNRLATLSPPRRVSQWRLEIVYGGGRDLTSEPRHQLESHEQYEVCAPEDDARVFIHRGALEARIATLRAGAAASGDPFSDNSANLALQGIEAIAADIKPGLFLLADGSIRAFWRNADRESVGLQFIDENEYQYVVLRRGSQRMLQALGTEENVFGLEQRIRCLGMERLWFHEQG